MTNKGNRISHVALSNIIVNKRTGWLRESRELSNLTRGCGDSEFSAGTTDGFAFVGLIKRVAGLIALAIWLLVTPQQATAQVPPPNDDLVNAEDLTNIDSGFMGSVAFDIKDATGQANEPDGNGYVWPADVSTLGVADQSVWFKWTCPHTGPCSFEAISATGETASVLLGVYTDSDIVPSFPLETTIGERFLGPETVARVNFNAVQGTTYYIGVEGYAPKASTNLTWETNIKLNWQGYNGEDPVAVNDPGPGEEILIVEPDAADTTYPFDICANDLSSEANPIVVPPNGDEFTFGPGTASAGVTYIPPTGGAAGAMLLNFEPEDGFRGVATFTYKAWDGTQYSATPATVNVQVGTSTLPDIALVHSTFDGREYDVKAALEATGFFNSVGIIDVNVGALKPNLAGYEAALVWSNQVYYDSNELGEILADFHDNGGGVVCALMETGTDLAGPDAGKGTLGGPWPSGYRAIERAGVVGPSPTPGSLGVVAEPTSELMYGVTTVSTNFSPDTDAGIVDGATLVASYASGAPLVAYKMVGDHPVVDLGIAPYEIDDPGDNSARLMANALLFSAGYPVPPPTSSPNAAPVANDDPGTGNPAITTSEGTAISIDVLANDTDADAGDTLTVTNLTAVTGVGSLSYNTSTGEVDFTPAADFTGVASFTYTANDGTVDSAPATVSVTVDPAGLVRPPNDDLDHAQELTGESGSVQGTTINATGEGSSEPDGDGYVYSSGSWGDPDETVWYKWTAPVTGQVTFKTSPPIPDLNAIEDTLMGIYTSSAATPAFPLDTVVEVDDGGSGYYSLTTIDVTEGTTYYIGINGWETYAGNFTLSWDEIVTNSAPVANPDPETPGDPAFTTWENTEFNISWEDLLENDTDADGDILTISQVFSGNGGLGDGGFVALYPGGITFYPATDFVGTGHFTYTANDGTVDSAPATVSVTVEASVVPPSSSPAVDFPPSPFFLQVNSHDSAASEGDWYSSSEGGGGANFITIHVPVEWPATSNLVVDLLSPDMNADASSTLDVADSATGIVDRGYTATAPVSDNNCHTRFTLYEAGSTFDLQRPAEPVVGTIVPGGDHTFVPDEVEDTHYYRLVTIPAGSVAIGGKYVLRIETLDATGTAGGPSGNGFRVRAGTDSDADPNNGGVLDNVDGLPGTGDELFIGSPGMTLQQNSGADAGATFYRHVAP